MFEDYNLGSGEKTPDHIESLSRIEHKEMSSSSDEPSQITELQNLHEQRQIHEETIGFSEDRVNFLTKFSEMNQKNQSLNIETNNSVAENISLHQVNKSFPNINSKKQNSNISPMLSGKKKSQLCTLQEMGNLNLRIGYYEKKKAELEAKIEEQLRLKSQRQSSKQKKLFYTSNNIPKPESFMIATNKNNKSININRSFQKRKNTETLSLVDKFRKTSDVKNLSLLGELEPSNIKDPFGDTSNLKCKLFLTV